MDVSLRPCGSPRCHPHTSLSDLCGVDSDADESGGDGHAAALHAALPFSAHVLKERMVFSMNRRNRFAARRTSTQRRHGLQQTSTEEDDHPCRTRPMHGACRVADAIGFVLLVL